MVDKGEDRESGQERRVQPDDAGERITVAELPQFQCTEEKRKQLFLDAVKRHQSSCPADAWVVVNSEGISEEGFVAWYATYDRNFLKENPQFRLCWAADFFDE